MRVRRVKNAWQSEANDNLGKLESNAKYDKKIVHTR